MRKRSRFISYLLLFVLGFSVLKNILPSFEEPAHSDCAEFGHIHFYKFGSVLSAHEFQKASDTSPDDEDCHEGKVLAGYFILRSTRFEIAKPVYENSFERVLSVENHFKSPYLEPRRKPPRFS